MMHSPGRFSNKGGPASLFTNVSANVPTVVIVGGGFGGLAAARALKRTPARIILIDRTNHHLFQPLLYQVATSVLTPGADRLSHPQHSAETKGHNHAPRRGERAMVISDMHLNRLK